MHRSSRLRPVTVLASALAALWLVLLQPLSAEAAGSWSNWNLLGANPGYSVASGGVRGPFALASWAPGRLDAFTVDNNGNAVGRFYPYGSPAQWSGWGSLGHPAGKPLAGPLAAAAPEAQQVMVFGVSDEQVWARGYWKGTWGNWFAIGGRHAKHIHSIAALSWGKGRVDLFVEPYDGPLEHAFLAPGTTWSGWENLGRPAGIASATKLVGLAGVSRAAENIDVFVATNDGWVRHLTWNVDGRKQWAWGAPIAQPSPGGYPAWLRPIAVTSWAPGRLDLVVGDNDGKLHNNTWLVGPSGGWLGWGNLPGAPAASKISTDYTPRIAAESWQAGRIDVVAHADNGLDYIATYK